MNTPPLNTQQSITLLIDSLLIRDEDMRKKVDEAIKLICQINHSELEADKLRSYIQVQQALSNNYGNKNAT